MTIGDAIFGTAALAAMCFILWLWFKGLDL